MKRITRILQSKPGLPELEKDDRTYHDKHTNHIQRTEGDKALPSCVIAESRGSLLDNLLKMIKFSGSWLGQEGAEASQPEKSDDIFLELSVDNLGPETELAATSAKKEKADKPRLSIPSNFNRLEINVQVTLNDNPNNPEDSEKLKEHVQILNKLIGKLKSDNVEYATQPGAGNTTKSNTIKLLESFDSISGKVATSLNKQIIDQVYQDMRVNAQLPDIYILETCIIVFLHAYIKHMIEQGDPTLLEETQPLNDNITIPTRKAIKEITQDIAKNIREYCKEKFPNQYIQQDIQLLEALLEEYSLDGYLQVPDKEKEKYDTLQVETIGGDQGHHLAR